MIVYAQHAALGLGNNFLDIHELRGSGRFISAMKNAILRYRVECRRAHRNMF